MIVLLLIFTVAVVIVIVVIGGITAQRDEISGNASAAVDKVGSWLKSLGVNETGVSSARATSPRRRPTTISTLVNGIVNGIRGLASLAFALSFALLSVFFLLKDGPTMRRWVDGHLGVPRRSPRRSPAASSDRCAATSGA